MLSFSGVFLCLFQVLIYRSIAYILYPQWLHRTQEPEREVKKECDSSEPYKQTRPNAWCTQIRDKYLLKRLWEQKAKKERSWNELMWVSECSCGTYTSHCHQTHLSLTLFETGGNIDVRVEYDVNITYASNSRSHSIENLWWWYGTVERNCC